MSNLIYNGDFSLPSITTNSYIYTNTFTTQQSTAFYWTSPNTFYPALLNGTTAFGITPPSNATQYIVIQYDKSLQQSFTATQLGNYTLSFNYAGRPGYTFNNLKIYLNGTLFDIVSTSPTTWSTYSNKISPILGTNTILLLETATSNEGDKALTNINVFFGQTGGAGVATTVSYNSFKKTNIYGGLTVYDYVNTATPPITISGLITTQQTYNYNYTALPVYLSSALGYIYSYATTATTSPTANSFISHTTPFSIPIGVYIVDAYCLFTPGSSAVHTLKLGINTISGAITSLNYTIENTLTASILPHSIQYKHYLSVATATNYYFVFNPSIAGSIAIGGFNGKFIRIG